MLDVGVAEHGAEGADEAGFVAVVDEEWLATGWKSASKGMSLTSTILAVPALTAPARVRQRPPVLTLIRINDP